MKALIDNDVLFKGACYGLLDEFVTLVCGSTGMAGVLGAAWFVVSKAIQRARLNKPVESATENLKAFISRAVKVEPTEAEQAIAGQFELAALRYGVSLDAGESQLCAILISRLVPHLLTGDKRAITAIEQLLDSENRLLPICRKVRCLEQLALDALSGSAGADSIRSRICAEDNIDKALTICFQCGSLTNGVGDYSYGLRSYISDLRRQAPRVLSD
jgi:hypothetical protein